MMKKLIISTIVVAALTLGGCSSLRAPGGDATVSSSGGVVNYALSHQGAPYRYGGSSPSGFDCSGFVSYVYKNTVKVDLPRTAEGMFSRGTAVEQTELATGDLVFFNTLGRSLSHVGIYIGNGQFVHASSSGSKRVMISSLSESYWSKRYNGARRIVESGSVDLAANI